MFRLRVLKPFVVVYEVKKEGGECMIDELLMEYKGLEEERKKLEEIATQDEEVQNLRDEIVSTKEHLGELLDELDRLMKPISEDVKRIKERQEVIKKEVAGLWDFKGKKYTTPFAIAKLRVTTSLDVLSKAKVVESLQKVGRIEEGVKDFDIRFLRKLHKAGLIEDGIELKEKKNVSIELLEEV